MQDLSFVDHIAVSCADLEEGVQYIEDLLGVKSSIGGVHPGFGTKNYLIKIGDRCFLEVIGPDPDSEMEGLPSLFFIDKVAKPTLTRWIATSEDLSATKSLGEGLGLDIGYIAPAQRERPDGSLVQWKLSDPYKINFNGLMPFFIDWGSAQHPAEDLNQPCKLIGLEAIHPHARAATSAFEALGIGIPVRSGKQYQLKATIECPNGLVEIS